MYRSMLLIVIVMTFTCAAGCDVVTEKEYTMSVTPEEMDDAIPMQQCVLLATVEDTEGYGLVTSSVKITAAADDAEVEVQNQYIKPGEVAEVIVIPENLDNEDEDGREITVTIHGTRGDLVTTQSVTITVVPDVEDEIEEEAEEYRDLFIPWLAENHPEFGIDEETDWAGTIVTPSSTSIMHYLFFSEDWEMHVSWRVMIPPFDWVKIELRQRFVDTLPSEAFEIDSRTADLIEIEEIDPSEELWR